MQCAGTGLGRFCLGTLSAGGWKDEAGESWPRGRLKLRFGADSIWILLMGIGMTIAADVLGTGRTSPSGKKPGS
jgi:hypothetical protein